MPEERPYAYSCLHIKTLMIHGWVCRPAPSLMPEALPAVTSPSFLNIEGSFASASTACHAVLHVSMRMCYANPEFGVSACARFCILTKSLTCMLTYIPVACEPLGCSSTIIVSTPCKRTDSVSRVLEQSCSPAKHARVAQEG